jgi:hypothetical protein
MKVARTRINGEAGSPVGLDISVDDPNVSSGNPEH